MSDLDILQFLRVVEGLVPTVFRGQELGGFVEEKIFVEVLFIGTVNSVFCIQDNTFQVLLSEVQDPKGHSTYNGPGIIEIPQAKGDVGC